METLTQILRPASNCLPKGVLFGGFNLPYSLRWERGSVTIALSANHSWSRRHGLTDTERKVGNSQQLHCAATLSGRPDGRRHIPPDSGWSITTPTTLESQPPANRRQALRHPLPHRLRRSIAPSSSVAYRKQNIRLDLITLLARAKLLPRLVWSFRRICFLLTRECSNQPIVELPFSSGWVN
jgi:hypothetical protein